MSKSPIPGLPPELNRRLIALEKKTSRETILQIVQAQGVARSAPGISLTENVSLGPAQVTDTAITLKAYPETFDNYEFAIQQAGYMTGWDTKITQDPECTFTGLRPETQYYVKVRGLDTFGGSTAWSDVLLVATAADTAAPPVPEGLELEADGYYVLCKVNEIKLRDCPDFDGFAWYVSTKSGFTPGDANLKAIGRANRFIFHTPVVGTTYYIRVKSYDVNDNYSEACAEVSIEVPIPPIPITPDPPGQPGELVIYEEIEELDDCDSELTWSSEVGAITIEGDDEDFKEGTGALKVWIDKYTVFAERLWYSVPNPPWPPAVPPIRMIGSYGSRYVCQGFKPTENLDLKSVGLSVEIGDGTPPGLKAMVYTDDGSGNPDTKLGEATFANVNYSGRWRFAEFSTPISLTANTQYWFVFCRTDEANQGGYYSARFGEDGYGDAQYDYIQAGDSLTNLTAEPGNDMLFRAFKDETSIGKHFKISFASKDISALLAVEWWFKSPYTETVEANAWIRASMGESALGEQLKKFTTESSWTAKSWDITGIADADLDAIADFGFEILEWDPPDEALAAATNGKIAVWVDFVRATGVKKVLVRFTDETIQLYPPVDDKIGEGHINLLPFAIEATQGSWGLYNDTNIHYYTFARNDPALDGDYAQWRLTLAKGTYTLKFKTYLGVDSGIIDFDLDGAEIASFDLYGAAANANKTQTGIVVDEAGIKTLKARVDGKNPSSSDYHVRIVMISLFRTA